jgi:hypothetical protein
VFSGCSESGRFGSATHALKRGESFQSNCPCNSSTRDKPRVCIEVFVALTVTPDGFSVNYEVLAGNAADKTAPPVFLR